MVRRRSFRSQLYRTARLMGDVEAAEKGPGSLVKREVRKSVYRKSNGTLGKLLRSLLGK